MKIPQDTSRHAPNVAVAESDCVVVPRHALSIARVALHIALVHQEIERHLKGRIDFARIELERKARPNARNHRHNAITQRRHIEIEVAEGFDVLAVESDLFLSLAQRRRTRINITIIDLAARKRNLPTGDRADAARAG